MKSKFLYSVVRKGKKVATKFLHRDIDWRLPDKDLARMLRVAIPTVARARKLLDKNKNLQVKQVRDKPSLLTRAI